MRRNVAEAMEPQWTREACARVTEQLTLVAKLKPGTEAHRIATGVLLALQDSLCALTEAQAMIARLRHEGLV